MPVSMQDKTIFFKMMQKTHALQSPCAVHYPNDDISEVGTHAQLLQVDFLLD